MDENVLKIRDRIRNEMPNIIAVNNELRHFPIVSFDGSAKVSVPCSDLIEQVVAHLELLGIKTCVVKRYPSKDMVGPELDQAQKWIDKGATSCLLMTPTANIRVDKPSQNETLIQAIKNLGDDYDVILGDSLGFVSVPHVLVTDRPREAFNMGLPGVFAYISEADVKAQIPRVSYNDMDQIADLIIKRFSLKKTIDMDSEDGAEHGTDDLEDPEMSVVFA